MKKVIFKPRHTVGELHENFLLLDATLIHNSSILPYYYDWRTVRALNISLANPRCYELKNVILLDDEIEGIHKQLEWLEYEGRWCNSEIHKFSVCTKENIDDRSRKEIEDRIHHIMETISSNAKGDQIQNYNSNIQLTSFLVRN